MKAKTSYKSLFSGSSGTSKCENENQKNDPYIRGLGVKWSPLCEINWLRPGCSGACPSLCSGGSFSGKKTEKYLAIFFENE